MCTRPPLEETSERARCLLRVAKSRRVAERNPRCSPALPRTFSNLRIFAFPSERPNPLILIAPSILHSSLAEVRHHRISLILRDVAVMRSPGTTALLRERRDDSSRVREYPVCVNPHRR